MATVTRVTCSRPPAAVRGTFRAHHPNASHTPSPCSADRYIYQWSLDDKKVAKKFKSETDEPITAYGKFGIILVFHPSHAVWYILLGPLLNADLVFAIRCCDQFTSLDLGFVHVCRISYCGNLQPSGVEAIFCKDA